jgi:hypothetical protein
MKEFDAAGVHGTHGAESKAAPHAYDERHDATVVA